MNVIKRKRRTNKLQTTVQTMRFRIPFFDFFFKKKNILGDDDGSTSPMSWYSHKSHFSVCIDDRDAIVVESLTCNDDDGLTSSMPGLLKRHILDIDDDDDDDDDDDADDDNKMLCTVDAIDFFMERASAPAPIVNQKKEEDRLRQILGMYSIVEFDNNVPDLEDPTEFWDPLSYFDPDVLRVSKKAMQQQVDQKKVELRNLGMDVPDDQTILEGLDACSSFGLISEALEKDPATSKKNVERQASAPDPVLPTFRAMLKREKERGLDMEFFDMHLVNRNKEEEYRRGRILGDAELVNRKKEEDRHRRILDKNSSSDDDGDDSDDRAFIVVGADAALLDRYNNGL
jgi:hypothetical protein